MEEGSTPADVASNVNVEVSKWFKDEEYYWRSLASYIWLAMIFPLVFGLFIVCVNISLLSPVNWITGSFATVFTLTTIATIVLLQIICSLTTIPHARAMSVQKTCHSSQLKLTLFLLHPKQFLNAICFITASSFMCSILKNFGSDLYSNSIFLSFFGAFLGLFYAVTYYKKHSYVAEFPVIQQTRFFRLKKKISLCFHDSLMFSLKALQLYYPLYILTGLLPESILPAFFSTNSEASFFSTISNICNISLLLKCFCISLVIVFVLQISNILTKIFNTQVYTFPIVASITEEQNKTLADAMESNNIFLKHLACLDYNTLSRYGGPRRSKMFDLNPPGNQAHCWNRTSTECLKVIENVRALLTKEHERKQQMKLGRTLSSVPLKTIGSQELFSAETNEDEKVPDKSKSWFTSPSKLLQLSSSEEVKKEKETPKVISKAVVEPATDVFEHLQITIWCIEGVCNLVAASLKEDKYGVVQQKLPDVIEKLLLLLEACELFSKSSFNVPSSNHSHHVETAQINNSHVTSLKLAVKTGLYTITTAFGYHISNIRLPSSHKKRLHGFLEFAE